MSRSADAAAREAKIAELKRLITTGRYETLEKLEEAVDSFLWSEHDELQARQEEEYEELASDLVRTHPK